MTNKEIFNQDNRQGNDLRYIVKNALDHIIALRYDDCESIDLDIVRRSYETWINTYLRQRRYFLTIMLRVFDLERIDVYDGFNTECIYSYYDTGETED